VSDRYPPDITDPDLFEGIGDLRHTFWHKSGGFQEQARTSAHGARIHQLADEVTNRLGLVASKAEWARRKRTLTPGELRVAHIVVMILDGLGAVLHRTEQLLALRAAEPWPDGHKALVDATAAAIAVETEKIRAIVCMLTPTAELFSGVLYPSTHEIQFTVARALQWVQRALDGLPC